MKILLKVKKDCDLCLVIENIINIAKVLFDFDFEKQEGDDKAPMTEFWVENKKVSEFNGLPLSDKQEFQQLVVLRFVLLGIHDSYLLESKDAYFVRTMIMKIDTVVFSYENELALEKYKLKFVQLCKERQEIIKKVIQIKNES